MTVESASYISQLNPALPSAADAKSEGDDHFRLMKTVLQTQFPNFGAGAVTATHSDLNRVAGANTATLTFSSGNMGLGMSPTYAVDVTGSAGSGFRFNVGSNQVVLAVDVGAVGGVAGTLNAAPFALWAGGAVRAWVMHTGQLRLVAMAEDPINGVAGDVYYSSTGVLRFYNGSVWANV
jgi:hypothetical protein